MILPIGITTETNSQKGFAEGVPVKPRIVLKFIATTLISLSFILLLLYAVSLGYIDKNIFK